MNEIKRNGITLARHITKDDWKDGLSFFSKDSESVQVGAWSYNAGMVLKRHIHNEAPRQVARTQEVLFVLAGSIEATIYDLDENEVECVVARSGEIVILLDSGHGYRILEDNTQVVEIKNGPYLGADVDRRRF
ncbi:MAG: cupin domain-containing protein [Spirochaetales bacterium]